MLTELQRQRAALIAELTAIFSKIDEEKRTEMTDEEKKRHDKLTADIAELDRKIAFAQQRESAAMLASSLTRPAPTIVPPGACGEGSSQVTDEIRGTAIQAWFREHSSRRPGLTERHREACRLTGLDPTAEELAINLLPSSGFRLLQEAYNSGPRHEGRHRASSVFHGLRSALTTHTASSGGAIMAPESMLSRLELNMLAYGGVLQVAEVIRTAGRERMGWPTADDSTNKGVRIGESTAVTTADPTFGAVFWDLYKYSSKAIYVPYELMDGAAFDLAGILGDMLGERIGRIWADELTTGTGATQPKGIVTAATAFSAASATAISWADIGNLIAAVDPAYRTGAGFMFHDSIRNTIANILDGDGHPMWMDGPNGTAPGLLRGYPWTINQSMDSTVASGKKTILFGQLSRYKVRMHNTVRIYRLQELGRLTDQDIFLAFAEADGNLLSAGTAPVKYLSH